MDQAAKEKADKAAVKLRTFIDEYRVATGRDGNDLFQSAALPTELTEYPTIRLHREQVVRFRNDWLLLMQFAALVCDCKLEELTPFHLIAPFLKRAMDREDDD